MNTQHVAQLAATHEGMRTLSQELRASIREATLERRREPRGGVD